MKTERERISGLIAASVFLLGRRIATASTAAGPSKEHCAGCGKPIPPGRAGRKCPECRPAAEVQGAAQEG